MSLLQNCGRTLNIIIFFFSRVRFPKPARKVANPNYVLYYRRNARSRPHRSFTWLRLPQLIFSRAFRSAGARCQKQSCSKMNFLFLFTFWFTNDIPVRRQRTRSKAVCGKHLRRLSPVRTSVNNTRQRKKQSKQPARFLLRVVHTIIFQVR
jgi:hypothetical protein